MGHEQSPLIKQRSCSAIVIFVVLGLIHRLFIGTLLLWILPCELVMSGTCSTTLESILVDHCCTEDLSEEKLF